MWSISVTERVHQMREAAIVAFRGVPWMISAALPPIGRIDHDLLRVRCGMAYLMPGVGVE